MMSLKSDFKNSTKPRMPNTFSHPFFKEMFEAFGCIRLSVIRGVFWAAVAMMPIKLKVKTTGKNALAASPRTA